MVVAALPLDKSHGLPIFTQVVDPLPQDWEEATEELACRKLADYFMTSCREVRHAFSCDELGGLLSSC